MQRNQELIREITDLRSEIERQKTKFNAAGGARKLNEITKRREEREAMRRQFEA